MNVKRYQAPTAREALRALKADLGADAIVLSNRAVAGGVEILALPAESVGAIHAASRRAEREEATSAVRRDTLPRPVPQPAEEADDDYTVSLSAARKPTEPTRAPRVISAFEPPRYETADYLMRKRDALQPDFDPRPVPEPARPRAVREERPRPSPVQGAEPSRSAVRRHGAFHEDMPGIDAAEQADPCGATSTALDSFSHESVARDALAREEARENARIARLQEDNARLMAELGGIRGMIERQLAGFAWNETRRSAPAKAELLGELLEAGFSAKLARELVDAIDAPETPEQAREAVRQALARNLRAMSSDADLIDRGGVFALVGPTGVGKTTTTAKIAARCVVRHGADKLAMITTDGYRIGAQEQLRIYGRILGVPVFPVRDASDLRQTLSELRDKHMVLIDTVGMSQRDRLVAQQAAMLLGAGPVKRVLLLNATARGDTLDDVIRAYGGRDLAGCILSKVDEAVSLAPAVGAAISHGLELLYVTNGQRVPEDLHLPNRTYLLHRAMRGLPDDSAWRLQSDEAGMMLAAGGSSDRFGG